MRKCGIRGLTEAQYQFVCKRIKRDCSFYWTLTQRIHGIAPMAHSEGTKDAGNHANNVWLTLHSFETALNYARRGERLDGNPYKYAVDGDPMLWLGEGI